MTSTVQSLHRADEIVTRLVSLGTATVSELATELETPLSTVYDYVHTLESLGYLTQLPDKRYRVSTRFLGVGNEVRHQYDLYTTAEPALRELGTETGGYAVLMIEEDGLGVILATDKGDTSTGPVLQGIDAGTRTRLNTTATGKAILSELPEDRVRSIIEGDGLASRTENTLTDPETVFEEREHIQDVEYAIDDEERFVGVRGIAVPIVSDPDDLVAAIGLYGPATELTDTVLYEELPGRIRKVKNVVQISLTYF